MYDILHFRLVNTRGNKKFYLITLYTVHLYIPSPFEFTFLGLRQYHKWYVILEI
jgi:hypothetical protein